MDAMQSRVIHSQVVTQIDPDPWLDERAKIFDSSQQLCSACILFFSHFQKHLRQTVRHLLYYQSLHVAAEHGCRLCMLLRAQIVSQHRECDLPRELKLRFSPYRLAPGYRLDARYDTYSDPEVKTVAGNSIAIALVFEEITGEGSKFLSKLTANTSSELSQLQVLEWLSLCRKQHPVCNTVEKARLPSRLIQYDMQKETSMIRMIETKNISTISSYIALSHCWGTKPMIRLVKEKLETFKEGIPLSELPKTFRHAFRIARWFDVGHIWIDSLCIIQDSVDDWQKEAATMKDVYRNAFLTIAATGAPDSSYGCFFDRHETLNTGFNVTMNKGTDDEADFCCFDSQLWSDVVSTAPLNQRAWVVQERLLSPRVVHMGRTQIAWECAELDACEACPTGLPKMLAELNRFKNAGSSRVLGAQAGYKTFYGQWEYIVDTYSRSHLTRGTDKIIALTGIAEAMTEVYQQEYMAGLWKQNLAEQLMWRAVIAGQGDEGGFWYPSRCSYERAPTWSWLSIDGPIDAGSAHGKPVLIEIIDAHVEKKSNTVLTGAVIVRGVLTNATCETAVRGSTRLSFDQEQWYGAYGELDDKDSQPPKQVKCLPIVQGSFAMDGEDVAYIEGLMLTPFQDAEADYERVGWFSADGEATCERITQGPFLQNVRRVYRPEDRHNSIEAVEMNLWQYLPTSILRLV